MKTLLSTAVLFLLTGHILSAQLNMTLIGELPYNFQLNDVWGWVAADGTEYALVGTTEGLSIVSLANPASPTEVAFVDGPSSTWRDIKAWGNFAYVSNETGGGLHIVDLSALPGTVRDTFWTVEVDGQVLNSIHNLFIDSVGYCYIAGSNLNRGGNLIVDLNINPWNPTLAGLGANVYAHDAYVRDDLLYSSEINEGRMAIYDITGRDDALLLGTRNTPFNFTHNIWLSDDGNIAFTTDERNRAPVASYDVSDPTNIIELDQFRPSASLIEGNIPHNVHVWRDWLILSYYGDGGIIVDGSRPTNLVEVGNFDTFFNLDPGSGAWGAYPFLPSGLVLVTDIGNGLYVLEPNYVRAAWLEGKVTDAITGDPLNEVEIEIQSDQINIEQSDLTGNYKTGQAIPGTFTVRFFKQGYTSVEKQAVLSNGELTILDAQLFPATISTLRGITLRDIGGATIDGASIVLEGDQGEYNKLSDENGIFQIDEVYSGIYRLYVGRWGYLPQDLGKITIRKDTAITVNLQLGYQDGFFFDYGWESTLEGQGARGAWTQGEPQGTYRANGTPSNPEYDIEGDLGDRCYVTGNAGGSAGFDDVDDGIATLRSPIMDLSNYLEPVLTYHAWFYNSGGDEMPDDSLVIKITNGVDTVILENIQSDSSRGAWRPEASFMLRDIITLTDSMQLILETGDIDPTGHLVEAALDFMRVRELDLINDVDDEVLLEAAIKAFPNPFRNIVQLDLQKLEDYTDFTLNAFNQFGQRMLQTRIPAGTPIFSLSSEDWPSGIYYLQLQNSEGLRQTLKIVKSN